VVRRRFDLSYFVVDACAIPAKDWGMAQDEHRVFDFGDAVFLVSGVDDGD
jgi:hypothetical protein